MMFGITEQSYNYLVDLFNQYNQVEKVIIYGSRAIGNYKNGSDIDLCIKGKISQELLSKLKVEISNSSIPYFVDLSEYTSIENKALKKHIDKEGEILFSK